MRKKEPEKLEKHQHLKEERERMWRVKASVVTMVIGALGDVATKLGESSNKSQEKHLRS